MNFWRDEGGQGIAECVILAPVYIVLAYMVLAAGDIGVLRLKCLEASRYAAFDPDATEDDIKQKIFSSGDNVEITMGGDSEVKVKYKPAEVVRYAATACKWDQSTEILASEFEIKDKFSCKRP